MYLGIRGINPIPVKSKSDLLTLILPRTAQNLDTCLKFLPYVQFSPSYKIFNFWSEDRGPIRILRALAVQRPCFHINGNS